MQEKDVSPHISTVAHYPLSRQPCVCLIHHIRCFPASTYHSVTCPDILTINLFVKAERRLSKDYKSGKHPLNAHLLHFNE